MSNHQIRRREGIVRMTLGDAIGKDGRAILRAAIKAQKREATRANNKKYRPPDHPKGKGHNGNNRLRKRH